MKYAIVIYESEEDFEDRTNERSETYWAAWQAYSAALVEAGVMAGGTALKEPGTATTIRQIDGITVQDGPFAATKEQLGGLMLIECENLDEAIAWAKRCPAAERGAVELRPVLDME